MNDGDLTGEARPPVLDRDPGAGIGGILDESAASALVQRCASPTRPSVWDRPSAPPALVLLCLVAVAAAVCLCPPALAHAIVREHGPVESLTAAGYLAIAAWLLVARDETGGAGNGSALARPAALAVALLAARELDLDKAFTTGGVLQSRLYVSPEASLAEKAAAAAVVVACLYVLSRLRRHVPAWLADLRVRRAAHARTLAVAVALLPATKLLDVTPRLLRDDFGLALPPEIKARVGAFEEVLELGIPLLLALALLQYRRS
ncbi:MAG TPA: hypothetical protein VFG47_00665, partial [Geminicoccaceae bacterium]|nr:hypothetical protein [Geminicoccaceae bacterium]